MWRCVPGSDVLLAAPLPPGRPAGRRAQRPHRDAGPGRRRRHRPGHALALARRGRPRSARSRRASRRRTRRRRTATVISTAGDALLSVADPTPPRRASSSTARSPWRARCSASATSPLGVAAAGGVVGAADAAAHLQRAGSNDAVALAFQQDIGANEPLRTGSYAKTLTFTLSTTTP